MTKAAGRKTAGSISSSRADLRLSEGGVSRPPSSKCLPVGSTGALPPNTIAVLVGPRPSSGWAFFLPAGGEWRRAGSNHRHPGGNGAIPVCRTGNLSYHPPSRMISEAQGAVNMQNETGMYEMPADRLVFNHRGLGESRDLGEATVVCNMWGRATVRVLQDGKQPRPAWLWPAVVAAVVAAALAIAWLAHAWPFVASGSTGDEARVIQDRPASAETGAPATAQPVTTAPAMAVPAEPPVPAPVPTAPAARQASPEQKPDAPAPDEHATLEKPARSEASAAQRKTASHAPAAPRRTRQATLQDAPAGSTSGSGDAVNRLSSPPAGMTSTGNSGAATGAAPAKAAPAAQPAPAPAGASPAQAAAPAAMPQASSAPPQP